MAFDEEIRVYLEGIARATALEEPVRRRRVDEGALRRHFLDRLRGLERLDPDLVRKLFEWWSSQIDELARYLEALPPRDAPLEDDAALAFACRALDHGMNIRGAQMALVDELEVARIMAEFHRPGALEPYALENRLIRPEPGSRLRVTDLGRVFLRLRGKDAVRWLLTVEVAQSQGPRDPWRTSRELLEQASSARGLTIEHGVAQFPFDLETMQRLERLRVVRSGIDQQGHVYGRITPSMRDVVQGVLDAGPWHTAVAALLEDERPAVLQAPGPRASEAAIEQTRMIAHEVRNALIPVRHHIDALLAAGGEAHRTRLETSRRGVVRVLEFVDDMIATSELVNEPATSFELGELVREVLAWQDVERRVEVELPAGPIRIRASRSRLLRAVSNLVQNALQAASGGQRVRIRAARADGAVEIKVDDAGPGVPEEHRASVFLDGFTTRPGGSGFGLAYVRRVVEEILHGKVWCEVSDLGGARFVIAIPEGRDR